MQTIFRIANREIERLFSGKIYWFCIVIAPLFACLFFLSLMYKGLPTNLPVGVVDRDNTSSSRDLARQLGAFEGVEVTAHYADFQQAQTAMQKGEIYGIFYIPQHFTQKTVSGKQPVLSFYTNYSYMIVGSLLFKDMKTVSTLAGGAVALQTGRAKGYTDSQIMASIQPIVIETHPIGNPWLNYSVYLNNVILPGILALLIMCVTVYSIGIEVKEKTVQDWLPAGKRSIIPALAGKLLPQTILFFIVGLLIYFLLYVVMQFPLKGGVGAMILALFLLIISSQAMGIFMIGCLPTLRLGLSFACLFGMIAFSITGFSFPVNAMYPPVQALSYVFPLRHYFLIYVDQALNGRAFSDSWQQYVILLAFLILPVIILRHLKWSLQNVPYQS
jgi:ABC-2 type transport system permease protein